MKNLFYLALILNLMGCGSRDSGLIKIESDVPYKDKDQQFEIGGWDTGDQKIMVDINYTASDEMMNVKLTLEEDGQCFVSRYSLPVLESVEEEFIHERIKEIHDGYDAYLYFSLQLSDPYECPEFSSLIPLEEGVVNKIVSAVSGHGFAHVHTRVSNIPENAHPIVAAFNHRTYSLLFHGSTLISPIIEVRSRAVKGVAVKKTSFILSKFALKHQYLFSNYSGAKEVRPVYVDEDDRQAWLQSRMFVCLFRYMVDEPLTQVQYLKDNYTPEARRKVFLDIVSAVLTNNYELLEVDEGVEECLQKWQ